MDRFEQKYITEPNTGCWLWTGALYANGYGAFSYEGRTRLAHRVAWYLFRGLIPSGFEIDHLCRVRCCVNPDHLEIVTRSENLRRSPITRTAQLKARMQCDKGHEFSGDNLRMRGKARICWACKLEYMSDYKRRKRRYRRYEMQRRGLFEAYRD